MKYLRALQYFVSTILIYLGFSLLGWGLDDLAGFLALPARGAYALVVVLFGLAVGWQAIDAPEGIRGSKGQAGKLVRRQTFVGGLLIALFLCMLVILPWADRHSLGVLPDVPPLRWLGVVSCGMGYALIFWSGLALGRQYSAEVTIQDGHRLVTTSLYRAIRHPRYCGLLLAGLGMVGIFRSWPGFLAIIPVLGLLLLRIRDEEALLHQEFGAAWQAYCGRSWRLMPYFY